MLALTHVSLRYGGGELRDEARAVFPQHDRAARLRPRRDPVPRARRAGARPGGQRAAATFSLRPGRPNTVAQEPVRSSGQSDRWSCVKAAGPTEESHDESCCYVAALWVGIIRRSGQVCARATAAAGPVGRASGRRPGALRPGAFRPRSSASSASSGSPAAWPLRTISWAIESMLATTAIAAAGRRARRVAVDHLAEALDDRLALVERLGTGRVHLDQERLRRRRGAPANHVRDAWIGGQPAPPRLPSTRPMAAAIAVDQRGPPPRRRRPGSTPPWWRTARRTSSATRRPLRRSRRPSCRRTRALATSVDDRVEHALALRLGDRLAAQPVAPARE